MLAGPDGWLAGFAGDLLSVRLRGGALEVSARKPLEQTPATGRLRDACAVEALKRYVEGTAEHPFAPLHEILIDLLPTEPSAAEHLMGTWQATATRALGVKLSVQSAGPVSQIDACPGLSTWMPWCREAGSGRRGWCRVTRTVHQETRSF